MTGSSPAPTASVSIPAAARANTQEGAVEFAKFFLIAGSKAETDWRSDVVRALSDPTCTTCAGQMAAIAESEAKGERVSTNRFVPQSTQAGPGTTSSAYQVDVLAKLRAASVIDRKGKAIRKLPEDDQALRVHVYWNGQTWRVSQVEGIRR